MRNVKIVATIGPASDSTAELEALINAGMNVARLNFSHGTHEQHRERVSRIREAARRLKKPVGILQDLQGPKIRVGRLEAPLQLSVGEEVSLYATQDEPPTNGHQIIPVDFRELFDSVRDGDKLLLDDGRLALQVLTAEGRVVHARVLVGGALFSHKGINLPGVKLRIAGFTEKDKADLAFGISQNVDAVAISFVRSAEDVKTVREAIREYSAGKREPLLIAKLEKPEALNELNEILDVVDGVMVARGDLGVELPPERVPSLQKTIIRAANSRAKLVITATQMLESMIQNPLPTRAEASDVANAVFDGTDAVMLSAETASGEYPHLSVEMMSRIVLEAESHFKEWGTRQDGRAGLGESDAASMARAANALASDPEVEAVSVFTMRGRSAWLMSKARPSKQILAFTPEEETYNQLAFLWGVRPHLVQFAQTMDDMLSEVDSVLLKSGITPGQQVVLVCGFPIGEQRPPNMALLHAVGADATVKLARKLADKK
ncbi:MAG: pyruvate kinase [Anaerolineales bacterium]|jgi:pyruvate kinase|nr:pyruvate kinase [Chloroflexota bacterium]MBK6647656.1 pyruvate kinase [Anaerolineales bacterium]MCC6985757.1 pyruvate kinase [Anaerolineales bacterium]